MASSVNAYEILAAFEILHAHRKIEGYEITRYDNLNMAQKFGPVSIEINYLWWDDSRKSKTEPEIACGRGETIAVALQEAKKKLPPELCEDLENLIDKMTAACTEINL